MVCLSPQLRMALARAMNWEQPVQEISVLSKGKPLTTIMMWVRIPPQFPLPTEAPMRHTIPFKLSNSIIRAPSFSFLSEPE